MVLPQFSLLARRRVDRRGGSVRERLGLDLLRAQGFRTLAWPLNLRNLPMRSASAKGIPGFQWVEAAEGMRSRPPRWK